MQQALIDPSGKYKTSIDWKKEMTLNNFCFYACWLENGNNIFTSQCKTYEEALIHTTNRNYSVIFIELNSSLNYNGEIINVTDYKIINNYNSNLVLSKLISSNGKLPYNSAYECQVVLDFKYIFFDSILYEEYYFRTADAFASKIKLNSIDNKESIDELKIKFIHPVQQLYYIVIELELKKSVEFFTPANLNVFEYLLRYYHLSKNDFICHYNKSKQINLKEITNFYLNL